jgi:hypothetical protein
MNDIYKQKAEKYKYKYLKLKKELEGGKHSYPYQCSYGLPIIFDKDSLDFGNNISGKLKVLTDYPIEAPNADFNIYNNYKYTGIILKHEDYLILLPLLTEPNIVKYTKVVYACTINKEVRKKYFKYFRENNHIKDKFPNCPIFNDSKSYGYIITKDIEQIRGDYNLKVEILAHKLINGKIELFTKFINHLIKTLQNFIIPLHKAGYILNNIHETTIKWVIEKEEVYFDITKMTKDTDKCKDIKNLISFILELSIVRDKHYTKELLKELSNKCDKNTTIEILINNLPNIIKCAQVEEEIAKYKDRILEYNNKIVEYNKKYDPNTQNELKTLPEQITLAENSLYNYEQLVKKLVREINLKLQE